MARQPYLQGTAFGGEFGAAATYISELSSVNRRGISVTMFQVSILQKLWGSCLAAARTQLAAAEEPSGGF